VDNENCGWQLLGRYIAIGVMSALLSGLPITVLQSLHTRKFKHVASHEDASRQMRRWRRKDALVWVLGVAYCLFAVNYLALFFANFSTRTHFQWTMVMGAALLQDLVIGPLLVSLTVPLLALGLLTCLSRRRHVAKRDLVQCEGAQVVGAWLAPGSARDGGAGEVGVRLPPGYQLLRHRPPGQDLRRRVVRQFQQRARLWPPLRWCRLCWLLHNIPFHT